LPGASYQGRNYLVLAGVTGTSPGTPLPGGLATLPLNWDAVTDLVLQNVNFPAFANFLGVLDANGQAQATLTVADLPLSTVGFILHFAYACNNPWDFVSNAASIKVVY